MHRWLLTTALSICASPPLELPRHARAQPRPRLFFFSGDLGSPPGSTNAGPHQNKNYSLGLRQAAYKAVQQAGDTGLEVTAEEPIV